MIASRDVIRTLVRQRLIITYQSCDWRHWEGESANKGDDAKAALCCGRTMINRLQLLRNIGQFDSVSPAADAGFNRLTLIYAENARGKTTLAAVFRSLACNDPILIRERHRFGTPNPPHVVIDVDGQSIVFENDSWSSYVSDISVFDDAFVDENVCSGLTVTVGHRQKLHEWIVGARGVSLNQQLQEYVDEVENHNRTLRERAAAIPARVRGPYSVDQFCGLEPRGDIKQAIEDTVRQLAALEHQQRIQNTSYFPDLSLPQIDTDALALLLQRDLESLDTQAVERVQSHFASIGHGAESWIGDGMRRLESSGDGERCPFCDQVVNASDLVRFYRAYFSDTYRQLKLDIESAVAEFRRYHSEDSPAAFERTVRVCIERRQFWSEFCEVPDVSLDTAEIARTWAAAREEVLAILNAKLSSPLERMSLSEMANSRIADYESQRHTVSRLSSQLVQSRLAIDVVKERAASGNAAALQADLIRLRAFQAQGEEDIVNACDAYRAAKEAKAYTERLRDETKESLREHRARIFPAHQEAINGYLRRFNASFRLDSVQASDTRGGPTCTYNVVVMNSPVPITGTPNEPGLPSFKTALSSGDRNTLALAFFFASLDHDDNLAQKSVVIDDPITSLDDHRSITTVQEIRRLLTRVSQLIVLSHSKAFLCRIWEHTDRSETTALEFCREATGSTLTQWNVTDDCITEHDRRHSLLREYLQRSTSNNREVATAMRPQLEQF